MMNIHNYAPKHVKLSEAKAKAPTYQGTFTELYNLIKAKKVTLVTADNGDVTGIYVEASNDVMTDTLAGQNFQRAYGCKPVMRWTELIVDAIYKGKEITDISEEDGTCKIDGQVITHTVVSRPRPTSRPVDPELPSKVEIDIEDLEEVSLKEVRRYLKREYGHCLAKGVQPTIDHDEDTVYVSDIEWGRPLSESEMELL